MFWRLRRGGPRHAKDSEGPALRIPRFERRRKDNNHPHAHHAPATKRGQGEAVGARRGQRASRRPRTRRAGKRRDQRESIDLDGARVPLLLRPHPPAGESSRGSRANPGRCRPGGQVQPARGLVEEKYFWTAHEGARDLQPPFHARAIGRDQLTSELGRQADIVQDSLDFLARIRQLADAGEVGEVLARRPGRLTLAGLVAYQPDESADGERLSDHVVPPQLRPAPAWWQERGEHADGCCLSCAVQTEESVELALRNL